jgi:hypothetical protein
MREWYDLIRGGKMMRRTPPIAVQVIPPFRPTNALIQARLIDFDTASANLESQHKSFLIKAIDRAKTNSAFHIRIFGFASRLGDEGVNERLSLDRMNSVVNFLKPLVQDGRLLKSLERFQAFGERQSGGGVKDNAPEFRAVEIHIFIGEAPPIDPPDVKPVPPIPPPPLPGGPRFKDWEIGYTSIVETSIPGVPVAVVGLHVFVIRGLIGSAIGQEHGYVLPAVGAGVSVPMKDLLKIVKFVFTFLKGLLSAGKAEFGLDFKKVSTTAPATFAEIEDSLVSVSGAGGGFVVGFGVAHVDIGIPRIVQVVPLSGSVITKSEDIHLIFTSTMQLGGKVAATVGRLIRVD